jgi:type II secretory pathway pseudopilin PulG
MALALIIVSVAAVLLLFCGGILTALLLPAVQAAREAARRAQCSNNLKQISLALMNYESTRNHLPPACTTDDNGRPLMSWRVEILPFLEEQSLYNRIDQHEPWDSPKNKAAAAVMPMQFRCPSTGQPGDTETHYMMVVGSNTVGGKPGDPGVRPSDITDGMAYTILVVEVPGPGVNWMEPKDITLPELQARVKAASQVGAPHVRGFNITTCDGALRFMPVTIDQEMLRRLALINDGQPVNFP